MSQQQSPNFIQSSRNITTAQPSGHEFQIRVVDYRRIHRNVKLLPKMPSTLRAFAGGCFGFALSTLLTLVPLFQATEKTEAWVKPLYFCITIASFGLGVVTWFLSRTSAEAVEVSVEQIATDMQEVYATCFPQDKL